MLFQVLGPLEIRGRDGVTHRFGAGKPARVLAALLLEPNAWVPGNQLIEATWQEQAVPRSAEANLKTYVWQLRRLLPEHDDGPRIEGRAGAYRLSVGDDELDSRCAAELGVAARGAIEDGDPASALALLLRARRLWRGAPFEGVGVRAPDAVDRLEELRRQLWESLAETQLTLGHTGDAVATLHELTVDDPMRESAWAMLVRALHTMGRPAQALATYRRAQRVLADELGVRPGPELAAAQRLVRSGDDCPEDSAEGATRRELPRAAPWFTGRADELDVLRTACASPSATVLVAGIGGVGKTALVVQAAHELSDRFPDGQFFLDLHATGRRGPVGPAAALARLLRGIGVPQPPSDVDECAALWRSELAHRSVLLVLDNAADAEQVEPLLPAVGASIALVTTRNRDWHLDGAARIDLGPLPFPDAVAMFRAAAGDRCERVDSPDVAAVVRHCGGVPHALRDAGIRLRTRPRWTVRRLAAELAATERPQEPRRREHDHQDRVA
ncbi:DNA-binding transcriptional activator of the SARP family [Amycolatopsis marina]|uniref:DNA-binding transcriptional activator of the SARP family n=1 Tax=Amycolatopsis marina TaxID=490629 RepID=A0A1I1AER6_9PSEU|nr:BTAD domain-containing putative transcriptional regulator [Amycolatopsis marina]SFB35982.1 DNA-binding transcriptional activator of the SARP family [Amycolatopsis marina]